MIGCGHCKALAPVWEQLANDMKNEPVVIAKFDAGSNDIQPPFDDIKITMYPTLYYFKKSDILHPVQFELKDRSLYVLKAFIEENRKPVTRYSFYMSVLIQKRNYTRGTFTC